MKRPTPAIFFAIILAVGVGFPATIRWTADWYWFQAVGFQSVFVNHVRTQLGLGIGVAAVAFAFFLGNFRFALRGATLPVMVGIRGPQEQTIDVTRLVRRLVMPASTALAIVVGLGASAAWLTVLRFLHATPFGATDPVFNRELSYYVFTLPFANAALALVSALTVLALLGTAPLYFLRHDVVVRGRRVIVEPSAQLHLGALIALLLVTTAISIFLVRIPSLLLSDTGGRFVGAGYADLHYRLPMLRVQGVIAALGALAVMAGAARRRIFPFVAATAGTYVAVSLLTNLVTGAVQRFVVLPNELARETPQLRHHITATREAWNLDSVESHDLAGEAQLSLRDIRANAGTIENVRLWDRDPLLQTFGQLQEIRTYYDFVSIDDDRYWIDGRYRQILLAPRELNSASLPTRNFINERLTFTHGMGLTLGPVNQVTPQGLPVLFIKDLPPASSVSLTVKQPAIYYGELSNDYVFVGTGQQEFDYPSGEANTYVNYTGTGGVPVSSFLRRLVLSMHFRSTNIFFSRDITAGSQVLYHRNVRDRARTALPFIRWDSDPYLVIREDGTLTWILDGYTESDRYPYAAKLDNRTSYMRNSVKLTINAYDGSLVAYVAEAGDPLIQTYAAIFPGVFQAIASMPADLRAHVRYPEDLFAVQASLYATYHMNEPEIFFHREDQWQLPGADARSPREYLRHMVMKLPGEKTEEYIEMTPFTPRGKDNLAAWMVARNDGENYGKLSVYRFPRQSLVFGPTQILNRINQTTEISQQISLWDQRGSQVIRGNLLVIPIEGSLIFVQALYLRAEGGRIPELKRVIVAYNDQVAMEETLEASLARIFGGSAGAPPSRTPGPAGAPVATAAPTLDGLAAEASQHYDRAIAAQRAGDWTTYGNEMKQVGDLLRRMRR